MKKKIALLLAGLLLLTGCHSDTLQAAQPNGEVVYQPINNADAVTHKNEASVYAYIGKYVTIDMVQEDAATGLAYVDYENTRYELGMDFLSKAMVYNCSVPENSKEYSTKEAVYRQWWRLYIQRWNYLAAEAPLYTKQNHWVYHSKIENLHLTPYRTVTEAILDAQVKEGNESKVHLGSDQPLTGAFRTENWQDVSQADRDVWNLTIGYRLTVPGKDGNFTWNESVLEGEPQTLTSADGTEYIFSLKRNLRFSDGTLVTARDYLAPLLVNAGAAGIAAGSNGNAGQFVVGHSAYQVYDGSNDGERVKIPDEDGKTKKTVTASKYFKGLKLLDEFTFSITLSSEYTNHYFALAQLSFAPAPEEMYLAGHDILVSQNQSVYLSDGFYEKQGQQEDAPYTMAAVIGENLKWDSGFPYSGAYRVSAYDEETQTVTLTASKYGTAGIETVTYSTLDQAQQTVYLQQGKLDVVTSVESAHQAQALVQENPKRLSYISCAHPGYGKLAFRCDYGPTAMMQVRRAILYSIPREAVYGPYYPEMAVYQEVKDEILLNPYEYSLENALAALIEGGWIYNEKGQPYQPETDAVRYKKLSGYELSKENLHFASTDGKYKTVKIDGAYYMPLAINWYGTQPGTVTDELKKAWQENPEATTQLGMYVTHNATSFTQGVYGELYRDTAAGYDGTPKLNAVNFATTFTSTVYDYSFSWCIGEDMVKKGYSVSFLRDEADFLENYM